MDDQYRYLHIGDDTLEEMVRQYVRGYILQLLGDAFLLDISSNKVKLIALPLLEAQLGQCSTSLAV